jgi:pyrroline-5-carboxylate reductase
MSGTGLAFIGAGNMAEALVRGILARRLCPAGDLVVADIRPEALERFRREFGVAGTADAAEAARGVAAVVLAVKPQSFGEVLSGLRGAVTRDQLVLSIAAGVRTGRIEDALGEGTRVVRSMPNTPALVGAGAAAISAGRWAAEADLAAAERILGAVGAVVRLPERDLDAVTAVSGSGPAYVFLLMEAMLEAAARFGLPPAEARTLVGATVAGAARLFAETGAAPSELRARVTSRGGTTEAALRVLAERGVPAALAEALAAARRRSEELSR